MDHPNGNLKFSCPCNFSPGSASLPSSEVPLSSSGDNSIHFPFNGFSQFQLDFPAESGGAESDHVAVPQPLECLQGNPIPPFLSKIYDLVEDPSLNPIIAWGEKGNSFVVWNPADFSKIVLPRYFKHANFSSFVRQLNTYGFRKIDTTKWEFANEFFSQGSKHLLKNIRRRRSSHSQQAASEASGPEMETKLEKLRTEKSVIMQEMVELQKQHRETAERMETVKRRLQDSEQKQKKMVSFVAKAVQNPEFIERVMEMKEQRLLDCSPRTKRKIVKQETQEQASELATSMDEQIKPSEMPSSFPENYLLQENMPFLSELVASHNLMSIPVQIGSGASSSCADGEFSSFQPGYFVDFPEELETDKGFVEFQTLVKKEEILSMGSDFSIVGSYNYPVNGPFFSGGNLDTWDLSHM